jgi:hypothetical protein
LSFFDDADEPRRSARRAPRQAPPTRRAAGDQQTIRRRQLVALGAAALVLILIILLIRSCAGSAAKQGLRDYNRSVSSLMRKSADDVGRPLFRLLDTAGQGTATRSVELQNQINNLKVEADDELQRASDLDVPGSMTEAQRYVLLSLELRRDGVDRIARLIQRSIGGTDNGVGAKEIAGQMRAFDASDVLWAGRAVPLIRQGLAAKDITVGTTGEEIATSNFVLAPWLSVDYTVQRLGGSASGSPGSGPAKPGTHGHGIVGVSVGSLTLSTSGVNRIPASPRPVFSVKLQNQGENDESGVRVRLRITGSGTPTTATKTLTSTTAGQTATATIPLTQTPRVGSVPKVTVEVLPVAGEKVVDNNKQTFSVLFTR